MCEPCCRSALTQPPPPFDLDQPTVVINALVAQALDDLEQGHLGLEAALRGVAGAAWTVGRSAPS